MSNNGKIKCAIPIFFGLIFFIAGICFFFLSKSKKETFKDYPTPLIYKKQLLSSPCLPYLGCLYPIPNPVNIATGKRYGLTKHDKILGNCSEAWKDCPAFADCNEDGQCVPKKNYN